MVSICFFSSTSWLSKFIEWVLKSPTSHVGVGITYRGVPSILHSAWGGVQITPRDQVLLGSSIVAEFEVVANLDDEIALAEKRIGEPYDTLGLFGFIFVLLAKKLNFNLHNPLASKSADVCSSFIVSLDINGEITEFKNLDADNTDPKSLLYICSHGSNFKLLK